MDFSDQQLTGAGVAALPNISVAFPGEHWSTGKASEVIVPGEAIVTIASGGKRYHRRASGAAEAAGRFAGIALNVVQPPDSGNDSLYGSALGPNEIVNRAIPVGQYVHEYRSGAFNLTLAAPDTYAVGDVLEWDPAGARYPGKGGTGSWVKATGQRLNGVFEVLDVISVASSPTTPLLKVRHYRTQM